MQDNSTDWWGTISLRSKITGVTVLLLTVGLLVAGFGTMTSLRTYLLDEADKKISKEAQTVALNIQTSFNTPPMAMAAYYLKGVSPPHVKLTDIFSGSLPFVFLVFLTMTLIYIYPDIALWLPRSLYK